jgi:hypothetical protein
MFSHSCGYNLDDLMISGKMNKNKKWKAVCISLDLLNGIASWLPIDGVRKV